MDLQSAVVVVDPFSTGDALARHLVSHHDLPLVVVLSSMRDEPMAWREQEKRELDIAGAVAIIQDAPGCRDATLSALVALPFRVVDVLVGAESGVELCDELCAALSLRGNDVAGTAVRIDKYEQHEALRCAGLAACTQSLATSEADVEAFLAAWHGGGDPLAAFAPIVVKPVDGSGSAGITKCDSPAAVRAAFRALLGTTNMLGRSCRSVLLQEHLPGVEYTVDTVSCGGAHKCVAIWRQDRRAMGAASPFMYIGQALLSVEEEPHLPALVEYAFGALDALGMRYGAACCEIKHEGRGRGHVLVEVNCRLDGGGGAWVALVEATGMGYTQVSALADMYFAPQAYAAIPPMPTIRSGARRGSVSTIRSPVGGVVARVREEVFDRIRALPSFLSMNLANFPRAGERIARTVDMMTYYGCCDLCHTDAALLRQDYDILQLIMDSPAEALVEIEAADQGTAHSPSF